MNRQPFATPPRRWQERLSPFWFRMVSPWRRLKQRRQQRLDHVHIEGGESLRQLINDGVGVMIVPNHASHADSYVLNATVEQLGIHFYYMTAWQVFARHRRIGQLLLQLHGCFSVNREGADRQAFRTAVEILEQRHGPLVVFPEGEVYHLNDELTPFREGAASIALSAARKGSRRIACLPCAIKYEYIEDPTTELLQLMSRLERHCLWRPQPERSLPERIYRLAEGALALKELEYFGEPQTGELPQRLQQLIDRILEAVAAKYSAQQSGTVPERVKILRQKVIAEYDKSPKSDADQHRYGHDLDDLFVAVQLFSYPGRYVAERPTLERMAETLDKFEEDMLGVSTASIRGRRQATVQFGVPIEVTSGARSSRESSRLLTGQLEEQVQMLLTQLSRRQGKVLDSDTRHFARVYGSSGI